jgi:hypothetical protein
MTPFPTLEMRTVIYLLRLKNQMFVMIQLSVLKMMNVCNISISNPRDENAMLHAKIDELNVCKPST